MKEFLSRDDRGKGDYKHKKDESGIHKITERTHEAQDHNVTKIPAQNCSWEFDGTSWNDELKRNGDKWTTKFGLSEMFHFFLHPLMSGNMVVLRHVPCLCHVDGGCWEQMHTPAHKYEPSVAAKDNKMFQLAPNCIFNPVMGDLNKWHFIKLRPTKVKKDDRRRVENVDLGQVNAIMQDVLDSAIVALENEIKLGRLGAVAAEFCPLLSPNRLSVVRFLSKPCCLQEPKVIEACSPVEMPVGTMVVKGQAFTRITFDGMGNKGWYEPPENGMPKLIYLGNVCSWMCFNVDDNDCPTLLEDESRLKPFNRNDEWDKAAVAMGTRALLSTMDVEFHPTKTAPQPEQQDKPQASAKVKLEKRFKALLFKSDKPDKPRNLKDLLCKGPKKKTATKRKSTDKTQVPVLAFGGSDKAPNRRRM